VHQGLVFQDVVVLKHVEVPLVEELLHELANLSPLLVLLGVVDYLLYFLIVVLDFVRVLFFVFPVDFLQEVIQVPFEPLGGVVGLLGGHVEPGLSLNVHVFFFA